MIFTTPTPFEEALDSRRVKALLPTDASSAELMRIAPEIRERAMFSARVTNARYLDQVDQVIGRILSPEAAGPGDGKCVLWFSNGTGAGGDGDLVLKRTVAGVVTTNTIDITGI